jgi:citrate lyase subunit beta/citryl-CoA lyase
MTTSLLRSYLFAPADNERLVDKVFTAGADAVVFDLEDAVLASQKKMARSNLARKLESLERPHPPVFVRINAVVTGDWLDDISAAVSPATTAVRLAKASSPSDLLKVSEALGEAEMRAGLPAGSIHIYPTIESAAGVLAAVSMAACSRVVAFCFGATDFLNDISGETDDLGLATLHAQSQLVIASRAAGLIPPIASVWTDLSDIDGFRKSTLLMRRLGFFGRSCIHPKQLSVVHDIFTPSSEQVERARKILATADSGASSDRGALLMKDGQFVDEAVVARARSVLLLAERFGTKHQG